MGTKTETSDKREKKKLCEAENMSIMSYQDNDNTGIQNKTKAEHTGEGKFLDATNQEPFRNVWLQ